MSDDKKIKKIEKEKESAKYWLGKTVLDLKKAKDADSDKKKGKYLLAVEKDKRYVKMSIETVIKLGGTVDEIAENLPEAQLTIWEELYGNSDTNTIAIEKEIGRIKKMLHKDLKKAMEKDDYNPNDPIELKMKSKRFEAEAHIGNYLYAASREKEYSGSPHKKYNQYWNYGRDYEATKDEYFTEEEQLLIGKCDTSYKAKLEYMSEKRAWLIKLGERIVDTADKIDEWGDITQARVWVNNMRDEVFPEVIRQMYGKLPKKEAEERALEMTREYVRFIWDDAQIEELNRLYEETEREADLLQKQMAEGSLNLQGKERREMEQLQEALDDKVGGQRMIVLYLLREKIGLEKTYFIFLYRDDHNRELRKELFRKYTMEELGL